VNTEAVNTEAVSAQAVSAQGVRPTADTRYLVTGAHGMLGAELVAALAGRNVTALGHSQLDIADPSHAFDAVTGHDVVLNAAAYTNVDHAEIDEETAYRTNALGAQVLATAAREAGARFVQFSTDYVFDGNASSPYDEAAPLAPANAYGRSKAAGERLTLDANPWRTVVIRTAWTYGAHGNNFAKTMLRLASERDTVEVVTDQLGQPTWTADLAAQTVTLLDAGIVSGIFHGTNAGQASWFDFARAIFHGAGLDTDRVKPTTSSTFVRPARRPAYSVLGHDAWASAGLTPLRHWREALEEAQTSGAIQPT
jgi:dTDP-4-dehydrorhamnose reductase